ncbi:MAG: hypothetical protein FWH24_04000 [Oscillospiraceae bacterium]|nr:hypothetical protein [Oscillospiraceae bacterium]
MSITIQQTEKLLKSNRSFSQLGFSLMLTRLRGLYSKDSSQSMLKSCMDEINFFLEKFEGIMGDEYAIITKI